MLLYLEFLAINTAQESIFLDANLIFIFNLITSQQNKFEVKLV